MFISECAVGRFGPMVKEVGRVSLMGSAAVGSNLECGFDLSFFLPFLFRKNPKLWFLDTVLPVT